MKLFQRILQITLLCIILGTTYHNREVLINFGKQQLNMLLPCSSPITYSIGDFDDRFHINKTEFLRDMSQAEQVWENKAKKELFRYVEIGGTVTVNLIYDERQAATDKLKTIGIVISDTKGSYTALEKKYNTLLANYEQQKKKLAKDTQYLEILKNEYEKNVSHWNSLGGAPKDEYEKLQGNRKNINSLVTSLNAKGVELNNQSDTINALAIAINQLIADLNLNVKKYNTTASNGEEFNEGEYTRDTAGSRINIYQFSDDNKLIRVLTHELGHALGLMHVDDPKAIMYRLNQGTEKELTEADIRELTKICRLK